ncbi:MAG: glutaredoxin family protein [Nitriliruptoraceae bacterium]|nr:glutaredoxin family protein [Nitriliruptoraceae bacterium]
MTRARCGLCARAQELIETERGDARVVVRDVDDDAELQQRYGVRVPGVLVDGVEVAELELARGAVRASLRRARMARALGPDPPAA